MRVFNFNTNPTVFSYYDEDEKNSVAILTCADSPVKGVNSYATMGTLVAKPTLVTDKKGLIVEFVGACSKDYENYTNILATCSFNIINSGFNYGPGEIYKDVVSMYYPNLNMKHILMMNPFLWKRRFKTMELEDKFVAWLQIIPISQNEYDYANKHGADKLEDLFEEKQIDIYDLNRKSAC